MTAATLMAIWLVHLAAAISPGPAVVLAARTSLREGFGRGSWLAVGLGLGACIWACAAMFGLAILFRVAPALLSVLKYVGAAYLIWLAWRMWRDAPQPLSMDLPVGRGRRGASGLVWLGIATQLANPKPAVFFGTIFLTFLPPQAPFWAYAVILMLVFANDAGWNVIVARLFSLERTRRGYMGLKTTIDRTFGGLLALMGLKLATT
ncbi:LysE family translocator [Paracoccus nototheniae]|uniref:LysE family translocator n=1 Tax=Paracoccus nototheniae TaxID=2489002 RepID=A0ABW4E086_9RHOB|nr:LysE family translocator [Paracoccus nototheniae]